MEERLTKKELYDYTNMDFHSIQLDLHSIYNKLSEFEDFMESLGCEKLEELEHLIGYPRFVDGYDEQGNEINRTEFVTYKESFNEVFEKNKELKQEKQALKSRWEKLAEYLKLKFNELSWVEMSFDYPAADAERNTYKEVLDKMQELEQGVNNA